MKISQGVLDDALNIAASEFTGAHKAFLSFRRGLAFEYREAQHNAFRRLETLLDLVRKPTV